MDFEVLLYFLQILKYRGKIAHKTFNAWLYECISGVQIFNHHLYSNRFHMSRSFKNQVNLDEFFFGLGKSDEVY